MASEQLVVFRLGSEEYAVSISQVKEIIRYGGVTKLPKTPDYIEGIINLRGKVLPVIDLSKHFGLAQENSDSKQAVIVEAAGREVGLVVDGVNEVLRIEDSAIEAAGTITSAGEYLLGIGKLGNRLLIILDLDNLFTAEQRQLLQTV